MIELPDVTLLAPTGNHIEETIQAVLKCCEFINFGEVKLVTHEELELPDDVTLEKSIYPMDSYYNYNKYVFEDLYRHVDTTHCLLMQYDSWIIHPELWEDEWLNYDYIGAPWAVKENAYIAWDSGEHVRVGNGGFSFRSKKLLEIPFKYRLSLTQEQGYYNEDGNICCYHRKSFLDGGIKYAPINVAAKFSFENLIDENYGIKTFGYHKNYPRFGWS